MKSKLLILALCFIFLPVSCGDDHGMDEGTNSVLIQIQTNYGIPAKIAVWNVSEDEIDIAFGVFADSHLNVTSCHDAVGNNNSDNMRNNRLVVDDINRDCGDAKCNGVVYLGDSMDSESNQHNLQQIVAFRQLFEDDYPGVDGGTIVGCLDPNYYAYSKDSRRLDFPVFPTIGNHDVPPWNDDGPDEWNKVAEYVGDRIVGAPGILSHYGRTSYIWRWGRYYFIQLGLWAGADEYRNGQTDSAKLQWLQNFLATEVGDSGLGVVLFQHYGWDWFSTYSRWWTDAQRDQEINVLCRREAADQPCNPYNVIGIFSAHAHERKDLMVDAGIDASGAPVSFNDFVITSSGTSGESSYQPGYSIVQLNGSENEVVINSKNIAAPSGQEWSTTIRPIYVRE
jgi:hypothetical protein